MNIGERRSSINEPPFGSRLKSRAFWDINGVADIEKATQYAEVGRFQIFLLVACLLAFSNVSTFPNVLMQHSYAIECDHQLFKNDKKAINDVVYVCLALGGAAWSLMADMVSRKWSLIIVLFIHIVATGGFYCAKSFLWLGVFQGLCSFCRSGIICITIALLSEFQISFCRGSMICALQLAWLIGLVAVPALPFSWQSLILIGEIPAVIAMFAFIFVPDSPRFLLTRMQEKEAIRSLQMIHAVNTGTNKISNFPISRLIDNKTAADIERTSVVKPYIPDYLKPRCITIPILMFAQFVMLFSYSTLSLWFPYLNFRSEAFFPLARVDKVPQDCKYGLYYMKGDPKQFETDRYVEFLEEDDVINSTIRLSRYDSVRKAKNPCDNTDRLRFNPKSTTLNALACMPSLIFLVLKIDTMGRKFFIVLAQLVAGCLAFASYYMHNVGKDLLFSCFFDSVALISIAASHCLAVELFPTKIRVLGVALVVGSGQCGSILAETGGAISFGLSCVLVVCLLAVSLATSGILIMVLPETTGIPLR